MTTPKRAGRRFALRAARTAGAVAAALLALCGPAAEAQKIRLGRTVGASGFHLPTYVAMDRGLFRAEGLEAEFVTMTGGEIVRAAIAKEVDYAPVPSSSAEAMLKGAPLVFVAGESLVSQWTLVSKPDTQKVEGLRGKTIGLGRAGGADYGEILVVLGKFFQMEPGRDFKLISFRGEPERIAALLTGSIQGAVLSFPHAARAEAEGLKVLVRTGDYLPRLGGTISTHRDHLRRRDAIKRFIRAVARAADYIRTEKAGTIQVVQTHFQLQDARLAERLYLQLQDKFGPQIPRDLLRQLFESVATPQRGWPEGKPLPDPEQFVARDLLNEVLKEMGRPVN